MSRRCFEARTRAWRTRARLIKQEIHALGIAWRDDRVPWYVRVLIGIVIGYAFSPIDLIPDFIPVLGYLDDLVLLPLGIALIVRLMPAELMAECRAKASSEAAGGGTAAAIIAAMIALIWAGGLVAAAASLLN